MARVRANAATRVSTARFSRPRSLHPCFDGPFAALPLAFTWTVYEDITKTIGNTPVVKISDKLCPEGVELYAKCEYFNPLSSVKDRLALAIYLGLGLLERSTDRVSSSSTYIYIYNIIHIK